MIACVDVAYGVSSATAACVLIEDWAASSPSAELTRECPIVAAYEPGQFYRRELPCLLAILQSLDELPQVVVVDGYVWLGPDGTKGLGGHLYEVVGPAAAVVGVAKTSYKDAPAVPVKRGGSRVPLFVTAAGMAAADAAECIVRMHGPFRIPTMLRRVDQLSRSTRESGTST